MSALTFEERRAGPRMRLRLRPGKGVMASLVDALPKGRIERRRLVERMFAQTARMVRLKPGRRLGAPWMDRFVAQRRNVSLCRDCDRKYLGWCRQHHYRTQREVLCISDCDGCGAPMTGVLSSYPEERYESSKLELRYPVIGVKK